MSISFLYPRILWFLLLIPVMVGLSLYDHRRINKKRLWVSLTLRSLIFFTIILAISGIQIRQKSNSLTTIFLLDVSDSIPVEQKGNGESFIRLAIQQMPKADRAAIIVFGKDALVERLATEVRTLSELESIPIATQTNIGGALQLAMALFPNEGAKRIVLLSDGQETMGSAQQQAELLAINQIELLYYPLNNEIFESEVLVENLKAPSTVREGEQIQLTAYINSTTPVRANLRIYEDNKIIETIEVNLNTGTNQFSFPVTNLKAGFHRYRAQISYEGDRRSQNNEASAFVLVSGPPNVLIIEGTQGESQNLTNALSAAEMLVTVKAPTSMPATLVEASNYDAIVLVNTPSSALPTGTMQIIQSFVRDLGKGFIMVGGENSFGAGGYLRTPIEETLPVNMDVRSKELTANLALILAIDKSGSMGRCHCDNPDLNQQYTRQEVGQPKVDIAKEAVMKAASALGPEDYLGVVAFNDSAKWALVVGKLATNTSIERAIGGIIAEGQTNIWAGVESAYKSLATIDAKKKHIILLTDGWSNTGDITSLVEEMASNGITLSIIAAGGGSAEYLEGLSELGNGRYYPAQDILRVPDIFLKETVQSVGEYIIEEPFLPLPESPGSTLSGIDTLTLPAILGYNGTTPKTAARLDLISPKGDPLLATWQYGLGRSAAWTSDMKGQWAEHWLTWNTFPKFVSQLVGWVLPEPKSDFIETSASLKDSNAEIYLTAKDEFGQPLNYVQANATIISPSLISKEINLEQVGPGEYKGIFEVTESGSYLIRVGANDQNYHSLGQQTLGLVVPYSPEYKVGGIDQAKLNDLAQTTGGGQLQTIQDAFLHNLPSSSFAIEIWRPLLLLAALLFPFDVAVRRLNINKGDLLESREWIIKKIQRKPKGKLQEPKVLGNLFEARERVRKKQQAAQIEVQKSDTEGLASPPKPKGDTDIETFIPQDKSDDISQNQDTFTRLRDAKNRSRKKKE